MLSLFTLLLLASSTIAAVAQPADAEPTKVTKLNTHTDIIHAPCHTADAGIRARQLTEFFSSPTLSEPSWMLFNGPTVTPTTLSGPPPSSFYPNRKETNVNKIVFIAVLATIGGCMLLFGLLGCIIKACARRSSKAEDKGKGKGKGKAPSNRRRCSDVEMTAGLTANAAAPAEGYYAPKFRRFEEMEEVVLTPKRPEPVYKTDIPPQPCHYPEGEAR